MLPEPSPGRITSAPRADNDVRPALDHLIGVTIRSFADRPFANSGKIAAGDRDQVRHRADPADERLVPLFEEDTRPALEQARLGARLIRFAAPTSCMPMTHRRHCRRRSFDRRARLSLSRRQAQGSRLGLGHFATPWEWPGTPARL